MRAVGSGKGAVTHRIAGLDPLRRVPFVALSLCPFVPVLPCPFVPVLPVPVILGGVKLLTGARSVITDVGEGGAGKRRLAGLDFDLPAFGGADAGVAGGFPLEE